MNKYNKNTNGRDSCIEIKTEILINMQKNIKDLDQIGRFDRQIDHTPYRQRQRYREEYTGRDRGKGRDRYFIAHQA